MRVVDDLLLSDAPIIRCPQYVEPQPLDVGKALTLTCDVQAHPAFIVHWLCCGMDRDVPDSVVYEKVRIQLS